MVQKTILCYGDSNTWGFDPATKDRFDIGTRWTGILGELLPNGWRVIEEGLNSRTTVFEDPLQPGRNGLEYLGPCLDSHAPLDLVVLMLGTNDLKRRFNLSAQEISLGVGRLLATIGQSASGPAGGPPQILLLSPPQIGSLSEFAGFFEGAAEKSAALGQHFRLVAQEWGCAFLDTATLVQASERDGVHLDAAAHARLAQVLAKRLQELL